MAFAALSVCLEHHTWEVKTDAALALIGHDDQYVRRDALQALCKNPDTNADEFRIQKRSGFTKRLENLDNTQQGEKVPLDFEKHVQNSEKNTVRKHMNP